MATSCSTVKGTTRRSTASRHKRGTRPTRSRTKSEVLTRLLSTVIEISRSKKKATVLGRGADTDCYAFTLALGQQLDKHLLDLRNYLESQGAKL